ncbi:MAG TPA: PH domain-containing protein [Dermatophilaceae bacterium]|jgi:hypothetical protein|nr:PH domain-containing protein [Dermatophilaceae bacterium]
MAADASVTEPLILKGARLYRLSGYLAAFGLLSAVAAALLWRQAWWVGYLGALGLGAATALLVWGAVRVAACGIRADRDGVRVKNLFRSHALAWGQVQDIGLEVSVPGNHTVPTQWVVCFRTDRGEIESLFPRGPRYQGGSLDQAVAALRRLRGACLGLPVPDEAAEPGWQPSASDLREAPLRSKSEPAAEPLEDMAQIVQLRRSRLEPAVVEIAVIIRRRGGTYVHRRVRYVGPDLGITASALFDPDLETRARGGAPSMPLTVEDQVFATLAEALQAGRTQEPVADPEKWLSARKFTREFEEGNLFTRPLEP